MANFEHITLSDRAVIEEYTLSSDITNCDLTFANMYCWEFMYQSRWAIIDGFLVIRFRVDGGEKMGYMQPIGKGNFTDIIPQLRENAHKHGQRLTIIGLTDQGCNTIREARKDEFAFASDRNIEDYIYDADDLRSLTGRKYQQKRNHVNKFINNYPDYRYEILTCAHAEECLKLAKEWQSSHSICDKRIVAEQQAMSHAFANCHHLGLIGGCIYVGDKLVAFTFGTPVNNSTFVIHIEKADTQYEGAFAAINRFFAEQIPPQYKFINREEDMGIEGLRRSKLSYHPTIIQPKYTAIRLHSDELACKKLWQKVFGDSDKFIDAFIMYYYKRSNMLTIEADGKMVSMLHLIDFESELGRTTYIYGVATDPNYRSRGYASQLMRQAMEIIAERGDDAAILITSEESLKEYYQPFGFGGAVQIEFSSVDNFDFGTGDKANDIAMIWLANGDSTPPQTLVCNYID